MLSFEHIGLLVLVLPLTILAWVLLKQRTNIGHSGFSLLFEGIMAIDLTFIQRTLVCLAVVLTVIALAKPYHEETEKIVTVQEGRELVFVVDTSSSMDEKAEDGSKMVVAKSVLAEFIKSRPEDRIAFFSFADRPQLEWPFSFAEELSGFHDPILNRLEALKADGGTNIARSLLAALDHCDVLADEETRGKAIILVSDGVSIIDEEDGEEIISRAEEGGIKIYWVWVKGVERSETLNKHDTQKAESVAAVIEAAGGKVFRTTPRDIEGVINEIGELEATPIVLVEEKTSQVYHLRPLLLAALALFIPATLIEVVKEVS